jgi:hypothetical protein
MSPEFASQHHEDFGVQLVERATRLNGYITERDARGMDSDATLRKAMRTVASMIEDFRDCAVFIQAPLILTAHDDGRQGVAMGEVTGEIVGFAISEYPTLDDSLEIGEMQKGVVAIIASGGSNFEGVSPAAWNYALPESTPQSVKDTYIEKGVIPILVPITKDTHFTQVDNLTPLHLNLSELIEGSARLMPESSTNYRSYIGRIEQLMNGRIVMNELTDGAIISALSVELKAMNANSPLLGKLVSASAPYMRTPNPIKKGGFLAIHGSVDGVLRKFIYAPYLPGKDYPNMKARSTVQAVIYPVQIAEMVYSGKLTPQEADQKLGAIYIPLDQEHKLEAM